MASDVVLAVVLDLSEDSLEDVLGQNVLLLHLSHVSLGDGWAGCCGDTIRGIRLRVNGGSRSLVLDVRRMGWPFWF